MKLITKEELQKDEKLIEMLKKSIFIYPTDTIYGIGCDALDEKLVGKIREIKGRETKPFSVIAPSKEWIFENCIVGEGAREWIGKLPGAYTLILKLKNKKSIAENVSLGETIGVRMPAHWISEVVSKMGMPIVTTSANITGKPFMTSLDDLNAGIKEKTDFIIYEVEEHTHQIVTASPFLVKDLVRSYQMEGIRKDEVAFEIFIDGDKSINLKHLEDRIGKIAPVLKVSYYPKSHPPFKYNTQLEYADSAAHALFRSEKFRREMSERGKRVYTKR